MREDRERGSYSVGRARRELIIDVAIANFAELGYTQTSMAKIAQDAGLTGPGLTHHFPTKKHLLVAVAERRFHMLLQLAQQAPEDTDGTGPLRQMIWLAGLLHAQPGMIELFVQVTAEAADPTSAAHDLYLARYQRVVDELTAGFRKGVEAGHLRADLDYDGLARECIAVADGLQLQWVLTGGRIDLLGLIRNHLERLAPAILISGRTVDLSAEISPARR
ncbi:TetR/AcrR family transcriptional regulator [Paractinoplanes durhamensis]|uniref:TetR family transcriptional regulator n=1 Tax=Paractinoplanes durhamensis TaxID=113563 RepID=A0ABQ3YYA0_9ACTN|nr:TetR/AcrR family transcriptional regulator [Actinoplanes durhamensis]GIE02500.1 TetR family transcriptional regulator [Actinoplanes durhamensis]